jgi:hypothetical protein
MKRANLSTLIEGLEFFSGGQRNERRFDERVQATQQCLS